MAVRQTAERRQEIKRLILAGSLPSMGEMADRFDVSRETIRKDLLLLEKEGLGKKGYGGTFIADTVIERNLGFRLTENNEKKKAIARAALSFISSGSAIFLDAGSTTLELARALQSMPDLHIITNSAIIPQAMAESLCTVTCLGGSLRKSSLAFTGSLTLNAVQAFHTDIAFLGVDGFDENGPCTTIFSEAEVKRAMAENAHQRILLCDSSKLDKTASVPFCTWGAIDMLITDNCISDSKAIALKNKVTLVIAKDSEV